MGGVIAYILPFRETNLGYVGRNCSMTSVHRTGKWGLAWFSRLVARAGAGLMASAGAMAQEPLTNGVRGKYVFPVVVDRFLSLNTLFLCVEFPTSHSVIIVPCHHRSSLGQKACW